MAAGGRWQQEAAALAQLGVQQGLLSVAQSCKGTELALTVAAAPREVQPRGKAPPWVFQQR